MVLGCLLSFNGITITKILDIEYLSLKHESTTSNSHFFISTAFYRRKTVRSILTHVGVNWCEFDQNKVSDLGARVNLCKNLFFLRFCIADFKDTFLKGYIRSTVEDFKFYFIKTLRFRFIKNFN